MLRLGMVGSLNGVRVVVWDLSQAECDSGDGFSVVEKEVRNFIGSFRMERVDCSEYAYWFGKGGKRHSVSVCDEWLCFSLEDSLLRKVSRTQIYLDFARAF